MRCEPTFDAIRDALAEGVAERRMPVDAIATRLHCSPSTIHRRLRRCGTTFAAVRGSIQVRRAFERLTTGDRVSLAAASVGVSTDHLGVMMRRSYGLTPRRIKEIAVLAADL